MNKSLYGRKTILFLDEVHRFNTSRQDALLPAVEQGIIVFMGPRQKIHFIMSMARSCRAPRYFNWVRSPGKMRLKLCAEHWLTRSVVLAS